MVLSVKLRRRAAKPSQVGVQPTPAAAEPKMKSSTGGGYAEVKGAPPPAASAAVPYAVSKERLKKFVNLQL